MPVSLDSLGPDVTIEAIGAPDFLVRNAVRDAAIDLCRRTHLWNEVQAPQPYTTGQAAYTLAAPAGATIISVLGITADDERPLAPTTVPLLTAMMPDWQVKSGRVLYFTQGLMPGDIRFVRVPEADGTFAAHAVYAPAPDATDIPDTLITHHRETLINGALGRVLMMNSKPWSNTASAQYNLTRFFAGVNRARIDANKHNSAADLRVTPRHFV